VPARALSTILRTLRPERRRSSRPTC
jgi:hypothetical protein